MLKKMALETKIDRLVDKFDGLSGKVDGLSIQVAEIKSNLGALTSDVGALTSDVGALRGELGELQSRVDVGFEESHRLMKLSLEALGAFQEATAARFDEVSHKHDQQFDLLEKFGLHVRRRVERLETPAPRRRRR